MTKAGGQELDKGVFTKASVRDARVNGKKVADPLYTGLDECTPKNIGKCPAQ